MAAKVVVATMRPKPEGRRTSDPARRPPSAGCYRERRPPVWQRPGAAQDLVPRAMRPSSASGKAVPSRKGPLGGAPWCPSIGGGPHHSYSAIGRGEYQPQLADLSDRLRNMSLDDPIKAEPSPPPAPQPRPPRAQSCGARELNVRALIDQVMSSPPERRLTMCPKMRACGICRLPSCPYIHEVCRPLREHRPLYQVGAPRSCKEVLCRFVLVLGVCPHGDSCIYSHDQSARHPAGAHAEQAECATDVSGEVVAQADEVAEEAQPTAEQAALERLTSVGDTAPPEPIKKLGTGRSLSKQVPRRHIDGHGDESDRGPVSAPSTAASSRPCSATPWAVRSTPRSASLPQRGGGSANSGGRPAHNHSSSAIARGVSAETDCLP